MTQAWTAMVAAAVVAAVAGGGRQGGEAPLAVSAIRFYAPSSATTTIEGVCELRLGAMAASATGSTVRYREEVAVFDSAGLELQRSGWAREVPAEVARAPGATAVETFEFGAAPGRYRLQVRAIPEIGSVVEGSIEVRAYAARPAISDLLLATTVEQPSGDTEAVAPGEIRRGGLVMRTAPVPHLTPSDPGLTYYAEIYPPASGGGGGGGGGGGAGTRVGNFRVAVVGGGGRVLTQTQPRPIQVSPAGGMTRGTVDLSGLPAGDYTLRLDVSLGDSAIVAQAPFSMGALGAGAAAQAVAAAPQPGTNDPFADAPEAVLDSMYAPLAYLLEPREQGIYGNLSVDGKRRFLEDFWRRRDPTHGTGTNQAMVDFYRAVDYANRAFREGGAGQIPGWKTDRGRVYLRNGRWDEILQRPVASPNPFEVWRYTRGRSRYYVFQDQTGIGHYVLLGTNDRRETGYQNWQQYLQAEDFREVARFLGLSLMTADSAP